MDNVTVSFEADRCGEGFTSQIVTNGVIRVDGDLLVIEFRETTITIAPAPSQLPSPSISPTKRCAAWANRPPDE